LDLFQRIFLLVSRFSAEVVSPGSVGMNPFDAVRHDSSVTAPDLRIAGPEELFVPLVPIDRQGERYRGKHGKVTLIRK
jgi:hypothetical protein